MMNLQPHISFFTCFCLLMPSFVFANVAQEEIGEVVFARGAVSAKSHAGEIRVLGKQASIFKGDVITTGLKSFSVIKMIDSSRISVRPDTVFSFKDYSMKQDEESAVMQLFKGGLRAISGLISKRKPEAFKLDTAVATIGIRGTDFDVRLCELDCAIDEQNNKQKEKKTVIAKIVLLRGEVKAIQKNNTERKLKLGSSIYEGDTLITETKSYAIIVFNDKSRMTLKAKTEIKIEKHRFISPESNDNSAVYNLIKGGIRALTGLITKVNKDNYKLQTATATIGIRGTGYDMVWLGPCTGGATSCGLTGSVWLGAIYAKNDAGEFDLLENQSFVIRLIDTPASIIETPPILNIPRPDEVDVNFDELFNDEVEDVPSGLYANTREGIVYMERDGEIIEMRPGEGGFVSTDGSTIVKLERPRNFQTNDPYLQTINEEFETLYELLDDSAIEQNDFECTVQ